MVESNDPFAETPFERTIASDKRWKWAWDDTSNAIVGHIRHSNGYTEMRDRNGNIVYTDEISIEPSLFSPVDLLVGGPFARLFSAALGRGVVRLSGVIARAGARKAMANAAVAQLRGGLATGHLRSKLIDAIARQCTGNKGVIIGLCKYLNDGKLWNVAKALGIDVSKFVR